MRQRSRSELTAVSAGLSRCPFCHDAVGPSGDPWVACETCLARHHEACWAEGHGCGACAADRALSRAGRLEAPRGSRLTGPALLVVGLAVGWVLGLTFGGTRPSSAEPVARVEAPARPLPDFVAQRVAFMLEQGQPEQAAAYLAQKLAEYPGTAAPELQEQVSAAVREQRAAARWDD